MVGQDASVVVDNEELEPARVHRLALGEQYLPAERHDVATEAGGWGGAIANALSARALSGRGEGKLGERGISARVLLWPRASGAQSAAMAAARLAASGSFHAAT